MRTLFLYRERALAAFALTYYCHMNRDREAHLSSLSAMADPRLSARGDYGIRNGQTIAIPIENTENRFFVGIYTQEKSIVTPEILIPAGSEDVYYKIITDYDGNKRIDFRVEAMEGPEKA